MYINTFQYTAEDVDCKLCTMYAGKRRGCKANGCPWLAERIEAGVVGYEEAVMEAFPRSPHLDAKLHTVIRRFTGSLFLNAGHRQRMENMKIRMGYSRRRDRPAYFAAMYLLTANEDIYTRTANCFCHHGIEFDYAMLKDISPHNYTLFSAARDICADTSGVMLNDLSNREVTDTLVFSLITNALLIARYGCAVLAISSAQSPLHSVSASGENFARSLAPPLPGEPASLGFAGGGK